MYILNALAQFIFHKKLLYTQPVVKPGVWPIMPYKKSTIFLTCLFRAIYSIGFMQTDILTVSVGIIETIGPIPLQTKCYSYSIIVWK